MSWQSVKQIVNERLNIKLTARQQLLALALMLIGLVIGFLGVVDDMTWVPFLLLLFLQFEVVCVYMAFKRDELTPNTIFGIKMGVGVIIATIALGYALYTHCSIWMAIQIFLMVVLAVFFSILMGN